MMKPKQNHRQLDKKLWQVYILECNDETLYTGISNDVINRLKAHDEGKGAKYTRGRGPFKLMAVSHFMSHNRACYVEETIKREKKENKIKNLFQMVALHYLEIHYENI